MEKEEVEKIIELNDALNSVKRLQKVLASNDDWCFNAKPDYYYPSNNLREKIEQFVNDEVIRFEKEIDEL